MSSRTSPIVIVLLTLAGAAAFLAAVVGFGLVPQLTGSGPTAAPSGQPSASLPPSPTLAPTEQPTLSPSPSPTASPASSPTEAPQQTPGGTYVVQAGDSLSTIGLRFGVPWTLIAQANGIEEPYIIQVGQELVIPEPGGELPGEGEYYIVQPGDTLEEIAYQLGLATYELAEANDIDNPDEIYAGQRLIIPGVSPSPSPSEQP